MIHLKLLKRVQDDTVGAIGILTTLILTGVLLIIVVGTVLTGISSRDSAFFLGQSEQVFIEMEGCVDEALLRLARDHSYGGGNFTMDEVSCSISVSGTDPNRDIDIVATQNDYHRTASLTVQLDPEFDIVTWQE